MIRQAFVWLALVAALAGLATPAAAQDRYLVPSFVYVDDDEDRAVDDELSGLQIGVGQYLNDWFAVEGILGYTEHEGVDTLDMTEASVNGVLSFRRDALVSPYLMAGAGLLHTESDLLGNDNSLTLTGGGGILFRLADSGAWLRLEHRLRYADGNSIEFTDTITTLGIQIAFGERPMPAPVVQRAPEDPDSDGDGVSDSRDACPNTPTGHRVDARGCSLDSDGDGVADADDQCPNTFRGAAVDARGCEMDDDADGVVNRLDQCPNTAAGVRVDVNGCEIREVIELPGVTFETNSDRLLPGADDVLQDAAATLRRYPDLVVEVAGHTDSQGAADYNQGLSERRAFTVRDYLINAGVSEANLSARGYGEAEPVADNATAVGRARNRRVELRIIE